MKLTSPIYLWQKTKDGLVRFPLTIVSAMIGTSIAIYLAEVEAETDHLFLWINLLLTSALGIPLFFCIAMAVKPLSEKSSLRGLIWLGSFVVLGLIFLSLPDTNSNFNNTIPYVRYAIYSTIVHLAVSFIPFINGGRINAFWNYNKRLFLRFLASLLYSGFLFVGLCLALWSLDTLFGVDVDGKIYFHLYIFVQGVFNTWFFVAGIQDDVDALDDLRDYPGGLKVFTQYILLPLLILYITILYGYGIKIIFTWNWPSGIVSYLIVCVAVLGILNLLLMHPYSQNPKVDSWIKRFASLYYYLLTPLIVLLFIAIGIRVDSYGLTVNRCLIILLGVWLSIVVGYFSIKRNENIKFIPTSLSIILLICSFGPWGIFSMSEKSQIQRLQDYFENYGILENGEIQREVIWVSDSLPELYALEENSNKRILPDSIHNEVVSIIRYLDEYHGLGEMAQWYQQNIDSLIRNSKKKYLSEAGYYLRTCGLDPYTKYASDYHFLGFSLSDDAIIDLKASDYMVSLECYASNESTCEKHFRNGVRDLQLTISSDINEPMKVLIDDREFNIELYSKLEHLMIQYETGSQAVSPEDMTLETNHDNYQFRVIIDRIDLIKNKDTYSLSSINLIIFVTDSYEKSN